MIGTSIPFEEFTKTITSLLQEKFGKEFQIFAHTVVKNNDMKKTGISVQRRRYGRSQNACRKNLNRLKWKKWICPHFPGLKQPGNSLHLN